MVPAASALSDDPLGQPGGLVEQVMTAIKERIRAERLGQGDPLPSENALALEFGVSRAVVREAFRSLAALKLIDIGNGRRARVAAIDPAVLGLILDHAVHTNQITIQQIYDVRRTRCAQWRWRPCAAAPTKRTRSRRWPTRWRAILERAT